MKQTGIYFLTSTTTGWSRDCQNKKAANSKMENFLWRMSSGRGGFFLTRDMHSLLLPVVQIILHRNKKHDCNLAVRQDSIQNTGHAMACTEF
jgi:hypothetical protein